MNSKLSLLLLFILVNSQFSFGVNNIESDNNQKLKKYQLEIKINNYQPKDSVWYISKCFPLSGLMPIDITSDKQNLSRPSAFVSKNGEFVINGNISEPGLYSLTNYFSKKSFIFMLGDGNLKIEINQDDIAKSWEKHTYIPYKHSESKLNDDLANLCNSPLLKMYPKEYENYRNWYNQSIENLWGITFKEYCSKLVRGGLDQIAKQRKITKQQRENINKEQDKRLFKLSKQQNEGVTEYLHNNPNSVAGLIYLSVTVYGYNVIKPTLRDRWNHLKMLGDALKSHSIYKSLNSMYQRLTKVKIGSEAPDFELNDANGDKIKLSDLRGNYVLVEFWEINCDYCKDENKNLHNLYSKYQNEDFQIISVCFDKSVKDWKEALRENGNTWLNVFEPKGYEKSAIIQEYAEASIPYYFLIDKSGNFIAKKLRGPSISSSGEKSLNQKLEEIFHY
jgi:peroxiredoxin